jgi:hypothetical protein
MPQIQPQKSKLTKTATAFIAPARLISQGVSTDDDADRHARQQEPFNLPTDLRKDFSACLWRGGCINRSGLNMNAKTPLADLTIL